MQNGHFSECLSNQKPEDKKKRAREAFLPYAWHLKKPIFWTLCSTKVHPLKWVQLNPTPWLAMRGRNILIMAISLYTSATSIFVNPFSHFLEVKLIKPAFFFLQFHWHKLLFLQSQREKKMYFPAWVIQYSSFAFLMILLKEFPEFRVYKVLDRWTADSFLFILSHLTPVSSPT